MLCAVVWVIASHREDTRAVSPAASSNVSSAPPFASGPPRPRTEQPDAADFQISGDTDAGRSLLLSAKWGSGRGQLDRSHQPEGNPEGPMSFVRAGDDLFVLDQVNARVARYNGKGQLEATYDASLTTQDIAVGKDGTVALLDRLVEKSVRLLDKNGRPIATLPLPERVGEPGLVTGVFVDGKDVFVEKEHGVLMRVGSTDGSVATEATDLTGRPSKDGALLIMATFAGAEGKVNLNAFDRRAGALRFARSIQFPRPARQVALLDTDLKGTIYVGVIGGRDPAVNIACLDPGDGHVVGRIAVPTQSTPEESFRDFSVSDDGTITFSIRTEEGIDFRTARCP